MPVPARRKSKSKSKMRRRLNTSITLIEYNFCFNCKATKVSYHICQQCGFYKSFKIINKKKSKI